MWNSIRCEVQGRGHIKNSIPCQDKTYSICINGVQTVALADGAGSAKLSHFGAENVVKNICYELSNKFEDYFLEEDGIVVKENLLKNIKTNLEKLAFELECDTKDLASTLLFVSIKNDKFILAHIGDGVIGYLKNGELKIASQPENGEFINTTIFTTSKDAINSMRLIKGHINDIKSFILMSDGTEESFYDRRERKLAEVLKNIIEKMITEPVKEIQLKLEESFKNVIIQKTTDDCSIVILVNEEMTVEDLKIKTKRKLKIKRVKKLEKYKVFS